jgi:hypothetical protein
VPAGAADTLGDAAGEAGALDGPAEPVAAEPVAAGPVLAGVPVIVVGVLEAEDAAGLAEELQAVNSTAIQASDAQAATCRGLGAFEVLTMSNPFNPVSQLRRGTPRRGWKEPGRGAGTAARSE